jgi:hypothetical protein
MLGAVMFDKSKFAIKQLEIMPFWQEYCDV